MQTKTLWHIAEAFLLYVGIWYIAQIYAQKITEDWQKYILKWM